MNTARSANLRFIRNISATTAAIPTYRLFAHPAEQMPDVLADLLAITRRMRRSDQHPRPQRRRRSVQDPAHDSSTSGTVHGPPGVPAVRAHQPQPVAHGIDRLRPCIARPG